jgi:hypothetical protein
MEQNKKSIKLPDNWWRRKDVSSLLSDHLLQGLVQLIIERKSNNLVVRESCTGFLIELDQKMLWISAAHVIDAIDYYAVNNIFVKAIWIDRFDNRDAPVLPATKKRFTIYSGEKEGYDFGAILIPILEASHFQQNKNIVPFVVKESKKEAAIIPEEYLFVGFPWEKTLISETPVSKSQVKVSVTTRLTVLPLRRIEHPQPNISDEHWDDPDAFYGEVLPYLGDESVHIDNFKGMSGGPILSFKQEGKDLYFVLEGIFASFMKSKKLIRAEPHQRVITKLKEWLSKIDNSYSC